MQWQDQAACKPRVTPAELMLDLGPCRLRQDQDRQDRRAVCVRQFQQGARGTSGGWGHLRFHWPL